MIFLIPLGSPPDSNRSFQVAWFVTAEDYKRARDPASLQLITDKQHCLDGVFSIRDSCFVGSFQRNCLQQQPYNYLQMMSFEEDVLGTLRPKLLSCSIYIRNVKVIRSCLDLETLLL